MGGWTLHVESVADCENHFFPVKQHLFVTKMKSCLHLFLLLISFKVSEISLTEKAPIYNREEDIDILSPELPHSEDFSKAISQYALR